MATLSFKPSLNLLEDRCVPAAFTFSQGTLTINMSEIRNRDVTVSASAGRLLIQGRQTGGSTNYVEGAPAGRLDLYALNGIVVNGSNQRDIINLSGVDTQFNNLNGRVFIYGNSGDDIINGTQFNDTINSGSGNDRVFGLAGNDVIFGSDGNDTIWGDGSSSYWNLNGGNDTIYCGSGNDYAYGGGGDDNLIGDGGQDIFNGGVGFDTAFIDSLDVVPRNGWQSVGIEIVRR